ncbi:hypothetical protein OG21DRAFT_1510637 [Imleria badia]|nr:hypothetical protein OG21DRAFT_1510637 [Imleria badia]
MVGSATGRQEDRTAAQHVGPTAQLPIPCKIRMRNADGLMTRDDAQEATFPWASSSRYRSPKAQPLSQTCFPPGSPSQSSNLLRSTHPTARGFLHAAFSWQTVKGLLKGRMFPPKSVRISVLYNGRTLSREAWLTGFCCRSACHPQPEWRDITFWPISPPNAHHRTHHEPRKAFASGKYHLFVDCFRRDAFAHRDGRRPRHQDTAGCLPFSYFPPYRSRPGFDA